MGKVAVRLIWKAGCTGVHTTTNGVCRFRPMTSSPPPSSPPLLLNLIEFAPNQVEFAPNQIEFAPNQIEFAPKQIAFPSTLVKFWIVNSFDMKVDQTLACSIHACDVISSRWLYLLRLPNEANSHFEHETLTNIHGLKCFFETFSNAITK